MGAFRDEGGRGSQGGNGSGTRQDPPSIDDLIKNFQKTINKFSGGKSGGSRPIIIGLLIVVLLYLASGSAEFYQTNKE